MDSCTMARNVRLDLDERNRDLIMFRRHIRACYADQVYPLFQLCTELLRLTSIRHTDYNSSLAASAEPSALVWRT
jgi:hypothetical protein